MNDALGIINDVPGALHLSYFIGPRGQIGQVDFSAAVGHKFLRPKAPIHRPDTELSVGDGLGRVGAVHLYQLHTGLGVIEENQFFCTAAGDQFHLLIAGVQDVALITGVHLHGPVGSGLNASQKDLALTLSLIPADGSPVAENFKGDPIHGLVALPVILHKAKSYFCQVFEHQRPGGDWVAVRVQLQLDLLDLAGGFIIGGRYDFRNGVLSGLDVLARRFCWVPPLDGLQFSGSVGIKLIDPVYHRAELKCGGADALVGICVPFEQDGLAGGGRRGRIIWGRRRRRFCAIGEGHLGNTAGGGELFRCHISNAACASNTGQLGGIILGHLAAERGVSYKINADCFISLQRKFQAICGLCYRLSSCVIGGRTRRIGYSKTPFLTSRDSGTRFLCHFQGRGGRLCTFKIEGTENMETEGTAF